MLLPAFWQERAEIGARIQARMNIAVDDLKTTFRSRFLFEDGAVDDITHAILLRGLKRREKAAERFQADYRYTCARRCFSADAAGWRQLRRNANGDNTTRTGTSCRHRSCRWHRQRRLRPAGLRMHGRSG